MKSEQECIPVGCVPPAAVVVGGAGPDPPEFSPWLLAWTWSPWISPLGVGLDLILLNFPLGCGPGSDPPQFSPWVWAWIWSPSISPLGVGLNLIPLNFPLGCGPGPDPPQFPPRVWAWREGGLLARDGGSPWQGGYPGMHWGRLPLLTDRHLWKDNLGKLRLRAVNMPDMVFSLHHSPKLKVELSWRT